MSEESDRVGGWNKCAAPGCNRYIPDTKSPLAKHCSAACNKRAFVAKRRSKGKVEHVVPQP